MRERIKYLVIVYTVGTFDLLHVGHLALLNQCKLLGNILVVGVASDAVVNMYKPNVPVVPLEQRVEMLEALSCVDIVRPYYQLEYVSGCKEVGADIFVVGEDWGKKPHNLDVNNYLREMGKEIVKVTYNPRTSSTTSRTSSGISPGNFTTGRISSDSSPACRKAFL